MTPTEADAKTLAAAIAAHFGYGTFTTYPPGFHSSGWTIASEDGPEDWPHLVSEWNYREHVTSWFIEPVNHWCLGLYLAG